MANAVIRKSLGCAVIALVAGALAAAPALATNVTIAASGVWENNAPSTPYSQAAGDTFAFAITVPETFTTIYSSPDIAETADAKLLYYDLNGEPVKGADLVSVAFFDQALGGGLNLNFQDFSVDVYGPALGVNGALPPPFILLNSDFYANINGEVSPLNHVLAEGYMTNDGLTSTVPEPGIWMMLLLGFGALGGALRASRAKVAARA